MTFTREEHTMTRQRMIRWAAPLILTLVAAACSNASSPGSAGGGGSSSGGATAATIDTADNGDLGTILVDDQGYTLYAFKQDTGTTSTCTGGCASTWPAVTTDGDPIAGDGTDASLLATSAFPDGGTQVTYDGHPLYRYTGDSAPGDTNGQGVGDVWFAVTADGTPAAAGGGGGARGY
jgi:predicted lipoprotein with Yx(FWY)xxD motif